MTHPADILSSVGRAFPRAWRRADELRADRGCGLPSWPLWCMLPMAGWYAIACEGLGTPSLDTAQVGCVSRLAALGAWRPTQGIYRFDPDLYGALISTPLDGDLPCQALYRLPDWCVFVETPGLAYFDTPLAGFWAHLEEDANSHGHELRFLMLSTGGDTVPLPLHLGPWPLAEGLHRMMETARFFSENGDSVNFRALANDIYGQQARILTTLRACVSLLLYLCCEKPDTRGPHGLSFPSALPRPKKTKQGWRLFPPDKPTVWRVGDDLGEALRAAHTGGAAGEVRTGGTHASPRPHIRRAHWHGYWSGPKKTAEDTTSPARRFDLRWTPPIAVAMGDDDDD